MQEELDKVKEVNKKLRDNVESLAQMVIDKSNRNVELHELVRLFKGACIELRGENERLTRRIKENGDAV